MSTSDKPKSSSNPAPMNLDFASALNTVSDADFATPKSISPRAKPQDIRSVSDAAGFPSRPIVPQETKPPPPQLATTPSVVKRTRAPTRNRPMPKGGGETPRVALRTNPAAFERLKQIAADQDPPWTVGYAFEKAVEALAAKFGQTP